MSPFSQYFRINRKFPPVFPDNQKIQFKIKKNTFENVSDVLTLRWNTY
jgi:hypothetical protein